MKQIYQQLQIEILYFEEDAIRTSNISYDEDRGEYYMDDIYY